MKLHVQIFKKRVHEYERKRKSLASYIEEEYIDQDGNAVIYLDLSQTENLYQPLSMGKQRELNPEIISFLDEKTYPIPAEIPVKIQIYGVASEEDRQNIESMIRSHYDYQAHDEKLDLRLNSLRSKWMYVIGSILLAVYFSLSAFRLNTVFIEILSIAATFIVWEAVDMSVLERRELKIKYRDTMQLAIAQIEFVGE